MRDGLSLTAINIKVVLRGNMTEEEVQRYVDYLCEQHLTGMDTCAILYESHQYADVKFEEAEG